MPNEIGKVLEIVSDLAVGQKRIEKRLDALESDMGIVKTKVTRLESDMVEVKEKLDQVVDHSVMNYDMNKHQNQRLDRLEKTTGLSPLVYA